MPSGWNATFLPELSMVGCFQWILAASLRLILLDSIGAPYCKDQQSCKYYRNRLILQLLPGKKYHHSIGFREPQEQRVSPLSISLYASGRMLIRL